ncbi:MAG: hypothetical protein N4A64_11180 [Marinisporobacter sp.]|jgi:hypothetical protein|nr:hypothetical protein [Marinisporobacter sp.]
MEKVIVNVRSKKKLDFEANGDKIRGVQVWYEEKTDNKDVVGAMVKKAFIPCDSTGQVNDTFSGMCEKVPGNYEVILKPVSTAKGYDLKVIGFADLEKKS